MDKKTLKRIAICIDSLPHAFDYKYWSMANTTYKEEVALAFIENLGLDKFAAFSFLRMSKIYKKDFPIIYEMLDGNIKGSMGAHFGVTPKGMQFLDNFILRKK